MKLKWLEIENEKWKFKKNLENSRETRISLGAAISQTFLPQFGLVYGIRPLQNRFLHCGVPYTTSFVVWNHFFDAQGIIQPTSMDSAKNPCSDHQKNTQK